MSDFVNSLHPQKAWSTDGPWDAPRPARASQGQAKGQPGPRQGASMHHGPCPAMVGHPRRDTDLILRPSESPTQNLGF